MTHILHPTGSAAGLAPAGSPSAAGKWSAVPQAPCRQGQRGQARLNRGDRLVSDLGRRLTGYIRTGRHRCRVLAAQPTTAIGVVAARQMQIVLIFTVLQ